MADVADSPHHLSTKPIAAQERLIFALDVPSGQEARRLVTELGDAVHFYKVGLELFCAGAGDTLVDWLAERGKRVFVDLKLYDVPETVRGAVRSLAARPITFTTVHGNDSILEAAGRDKGTLKVLAVTVLTSLDQRDLAELGYSADIETLVLSRSRWALELDCDGVICSGLEARRIRAELGEKVLIVCPGIRPAENRPADDQKRVVDVSQAFRNGADYIVVGRPIRSSPDPRRAALAIQETIASIFAG